MFSLEVIKKRSLVAVRIITPFIWYFSKDVFDLLFLAQNRKSKAQDLLLLYVDWLIDQFFLFLDFSSGSSWRILFQTTFKMYWLAYMEFKAAIGSGDKKSVHHQSQYHKNTIYRFFQSGLLIITRRQQRRIVILLLSLHQRKRSLRSLVLYVLPEQMQTKLLLHVLSSWNQKSSAKGEA